LTKAEHADLIARARAAAQRALGLPIASLPPPAGAAIEPGAAFVTWKRAGRLRGCIGSVEPYRPLAEDVESNAVAALLHDPRFPPATAKDYPQLSVEISVLTPREPIAGPDDLTIGRHGVWVDHGRRRAILLPQVAPEWGWNAQELLTQVCLKAGLPGDAWTTGKGIYRFEAEVFGEE